MKADLLKWMPLAALAVSLIGTAYVTLDRQQALADEVKDNSESIDENEEELDELRLLLLQQQGDQSREIGEIQGDIKLILRLLEERQ